MPKSHTSLCVLSGSEDGDTVGIAQDILNKAGLVSGDIVSCEVSNEKIVISKTHSPQKNTLENLFRDYDGGSFKTDLADLGDPAGMEKWQTASPGVTRVSDPSLRPRPGSGWTTTLPCGRRR
jgi:antitoxin component of MazEF toxin-antitoxin module